MSERLIEPRYFDHQRAHLDHRKSYVFVREANEMKIHHILSDYTYLAQLIKIDWDDY